MADYISARDGWMTGDVSASICNVYLVFYELNLARLLSFYHHPQSTTVSDSEYLWLFTGVKVEIKRRWNYKILWAPHKISWAPYFFWLTL